ncbi:Protein NRT1/ PTR FAMILY 2.13 [Linum perenne]
MSAAAAANNKNPVGWRAIKYLLGNEICDKIATVGMSANLMVYLVREYHMELPKAVLVVNVWYGFTNFLPLVGGFVSDAYIGRFKTIAFSAIAQLLGMLIVTLTAWLPNLRPPSCQNDEFCTGPTTPQVAVLATGLCLLSMGTGGIRPCSIPFAVDQFDPMTREGEKGIDSFFNWYYLSLTIVTMLSTVIVFFIQDRIGWVVGFGISSVFMAVAIGLFFAGSRLYVHVKPEGSVFSGIARVVCAAYRKRKLNLDDERFYNPSEVIDKLPFTDQFRFLNKAALVENHNEINQYDEPANPWRLASIQKVEELKCLLKVIPVWSAGIISLTAAAQQGTFMVSQALAMNRHLGKVEIPAGTVTAISFAVIALWLPLYDLVLVPKLRRITRHNTGITLLQRMGIGMVFSMLSMIIAGLVERKRRGFANTHPDELPVSVFWLAPQLAMMGMCEAFLFIGQLELFNKELPHNMASMATALFSVSIAAANYLSSLLISVIRKQTGAGRRHGWLTNDLNSGRLDLFYFLLAGIGFFNFLYFVYWARKYRYKATAPVIVLEEEVEMEENVDWPETSSLYDDVEISLA